MRDDANSDAGHAEPSQGSHADAGTGADPPADPLLPPGTAIGDYRLEHKIGEGGTATVYAAVHPLIGKRAAVKVMSARLCADASAVERFLSEARTVNQIRHPHIVDVFAFGVLPDGRHYLVSEWLEGETLARRLARRPLGPVESLDILEQIVDALEAVHDRGVIHRDLKPDNIFLVPVHGGRRTLVKLLDFGIAKLTGGGGFARARTRTGLFVGTPTHVSPEQARGLAVDARTDLYALGVTAYEMFLGRLPFDAPTAVDLITQHLLEPPPPPRALWPEIPPLLDQMLLALLAKRAEERPLLTDVREWLQALTTELAISPPRRPLSPAGGLPVVTPPPRKSPALASPVGPGVGAMDATEPRGLVERRPHVPGHIVEVNPRPLEPGHPRLRRALLLLGLGAAAAGAAALSLTLTARPEPTPTGPPPAELHVELDTPARIVVDGDLLAAHAATATTALEPGREHLIVVSPHHGHPIERRLRAEPGRRYDLTFALTRPTR